MDGASGVDSVLIRIIVADSQAVYRVGLIKVLSSEIDMRVVAQATTLEGLTGPLSAFSASRQRKARPHTP
jgi:DNA-binding NarL/FixJ family response regulator